MYCKYNEIYQRVRKEINSCEVLDSDSEKESSSGYSGSEYGDNGSDLDVDDSDSDLHVKDEGGPINGEEGNDREIEDASMNDRAKEKGKVKAMSVCEGNKKVCDKDKNKTRSKGIEIHETGDNWNVRVDDFNVASESEYDSDDFESLDDSYDFEEDP